MAIDNTNKLYSISYLSQEINSVSKLNSIYDFWESAFVGFEGVQITRTDNGSTYGNNNENLQDMDIYLCNNITAENVVSDLLFRFKSSITSSTGTDLIDVKIYLMIKDKNASEYTIKTSFNNQNGDFYHWFYKTDYGVTLKFPNSPKPSSYNLAFNGCDIIFIPGNNSNNTCPTVIYDIEQNMDSYGTDCIISSKHNDVEQLVSNGLLAYNYDTIDTELQRFILLNAFSMVTPINTPHLYRVIAVPSTNLKRGKIKIGNKYFIWIGRYALETTE